MSRVTVLVPGPLVLTGMSVMRLSFLRTVAAGGAVLQSYFALQEVLGWGPGFVARAAPAWIGPRLPDGSAPSEILGHIAWSKDLALNMGVYNLVLAIGLAWVAVAGARVAGSLGMFLAVWLLMAAAAAGWTQVIPALVAQGLLGLMLLLASLRAARRPIGSRAGLADGLLGGSHPMADLVVVAFDRPDTADRVLRKLAAMGKEQLLELEDACVVVRPPHGKIRLKQAVSLTRLGALSGASGGAFSGMLTGLVFPDPLAGVIAGAGAGAALGAGVGALAAQFWNHGIDDDVIRGLGNTIKPDSSALFLLVRRVTSDEALERLRAEGVRGEVLKTSLGHEQEAALKKALSVAETAAPVA